MACLDARLRKLQEEAIQREVAQEMARWEPVNQALSGPSDDRAAVRHTVEDCVRRQRTYVPAADALVNERIRHLVERAAAEYDIPADDIYTEMDRILRIAQELGVV